MRLLAVRITYCLILLNIINGYSQKIINQHNDSLPSITADSIIQVIDTVPQFMHHSRSDTVKTKHLITKNDTASMPLNLEVKKFKPNPTKAIIYSAIFPGMGQIYNKKYWKLPIVYGGFIGFSYAISWNGRYYTDYSNGYKDIMDDDQSTDRWKNFLPYGMDPESVDKEWLRDVLKRRKDFYRRFRDLSIIGTVGMYALCIIDAYVDAQLFDFDMSQDLSFRIEPTIIQKTDYLANSFGVQCSISF